MPESLCEMSVCEMCPVARRRFKRLSFQIWLHCDCSGVEKLAACGFRSASDRELCSVKTVLVVSNECGGEVVVVVCRRRRELKGTPREVPTPVLLLCTTPSNLIARRLCHLLRRSNRLGLRLEIKIAIQHMLAVTLTTTTRWGRMRVTI